jgi:outer membrane receptor protein involved in Fe transport
LTDLIRLKFGYFTCILLASTIGVPAATAVAQVAKQVQAAPLPQDGEEIVVTARKREERLIDIPIAATSISAATLTRYNTATLQDVALLVPTLTFDRGSGGSGASASLRGISSSFNDAALEQAVLLDLDGMPISRGRIFNDAMFDLEAVEVLKGPQSLFFGKDSPGGVVSIQTKGPGSELEGYMRTGYETTTQQESVEGAVSIPVTDVLGVRLAGLFNNSNGYVHNNDPGIADPFTAAHEFIPANPSTLGAERNIDGRLTVAYKPNDDRFTAQLKFTGTSVHGTGLGALEEIMSCPNGASHPATHGIADPYGDCSLNNQVSSGTLPASDITPWKQISGNGQALLDNMSLLPVLTLNYNFDNISVTSVSGLYYYDFLNQGNQDSTAYSSAYTYTAEKNTTISQEVHLVSSFDSPINFSVGAYYEHNDRTLDAGALLSPLPVDPATGKVNSYDAVEKNTGDDYSAFTEGTWKITDAIELAGGARYSIETKNVDLANIYVNPAAAGFLAQNKHIVGSKSWYDISPEGTLTWHITPTFMTYVAYKTGVLSGGFSNPGTISAKVTLASDTYNPEKATGEEIGAKALLLDGKLNADVTLYHYSYDGLQLTSLNAATATFVTQNAATTITQGIEIQGRYATPIEGLSVRASFSYDDAHFDSFTGAQCYAGQTVATGCIGGAQNESNEPLYRAPKFDWSIGGSYDLALPSRYLLSVSTDVHVKSSYFVNVDLNPGSLQKGYATVDASARLTLPDDRWEFAVIGRNLTNVEYGTVGLDKPYGTGEVATITGLPRTVRMQLSYKF